MPALPPSTARVGTHAIHPQQRGSQMAAFLPGGSAALQSAATTTTTGHPASQQRQSLGGQGPDYVWANRRAIRHLAASHQRRKQLEAEAAAEERAREQWKMARFGAIRSRIAAIMNESRPPEPDPDAELSSESFLYSTSDSTTNAAPASSHHHAFLRRGALEHRVAAKGAQARLRRFRGDVQPISGPRPRSFSSSSTASSSSVSPGGASLPVGLGLGSGSGGTMRAKTILKPAVPKATDLAPLLRLPPRNHIVANRAAAVQNQHAKRSTATEEGDGPYRHEAFGRVPDYLVKRQQAQAAEEERRRAERGDPDCPLGMRLLTEAERQETLAALDAQERELQRLLLRVPLRVDTPSMARRKQDLEARVAEVGRHRALFLRPKVYIVDDGVDPDEGEGPVSV